MSIKYFKWIPLCFVLLAVQCGESKKQQGEKDPPKGEELKPNRHGVGNGGGAVEGEGGQYDLADLHFKSRSEGVFELGDDMRFTLEQLSQVLYKWHIDAGEFFDSQVLDDHVGFELVSELPDFCFSDFETVREHGAEMVACTQGPMTWILPERYAKLPDDQKMGLIIHERLHAFSESLSHDVIFPFVKGVLTFYKLWQLDQEGDVALDDSQLSDLQGLRIASRLLGFARLSENGAPRIHRNGGGLVAVQDGTSISDASYVSLLSEVDNSVIVGDVFLKNASIKNSYVSKDSSIISSLVNHSHFEAQLEISNSTLTKIKTKTNVTISNSKLEFDIKGDELNIGRGVIIAGSKIHGKLLMGLDSYIGDDVIVDQVELALGSIILEEAGGVLGLGSGSIIKNSQIGVGRDFIIGEGSIILRSKFYNELGSLNHRLGLKFTIVDSTVNITGHEGKVYEVPELDLDNVTLKVGGIVSMIGTLKMSNSSIHLTGVLEIDFTHKYSSDCRIEPVFVDYIMLLDNCNYILEN